jgi:hypothetical protein
MLASGVVRAVDAEPFGVKIELTPDGIKSSCPCPAFAKASQHCKHVAALLIAVRDQARGSQPRREPPPPAISAPASNGSAPDSMKRGRRRDRRGRSTPGGASSTMAAMGPPGSTVGPAVPMPVAHHASLASGLAAIPQDASAKPTGIGAWLPPEGVSGPRKLEFRVHVRPARSRSPCSTPRRACRSCPPRPCRGRPSSPRPTATRCACSRASRAATHATPRSTSAPRTWLSCSRARGPARAARAGAHAAALRRRAAPPPLRSRDGRGRHDHRQGELRAPERQTPLFAACPAAGSRAGRAGTSTRRRASLAASTGASPAGAAPSAALPHHRRADERARARHHAGPASRRARGRRRAPRSVQIATSSTWCRPSACARAARSWRPACPLRRIRRPRDPGPRRRHHPPRAHQPAGGGLARASLHPRRHRRPAGGRQRLAELGLEPDDRPALRRPRRLGDPVLDRGLGALPEDVGPLRPRRPRRHAGPTRPIGVFAKVTSGMDWLNVKLSSRRGRRRRPRRAPALPRRGRSTSGSPTARSRRSTPIRSAPCSTARSSS